VSPEFVLVMFSSASMVLTSAVLLSQNPNSLSFSLDGGADPSRLLECGVNSI
jgi:hypothetical protein